MHHLVPGAVMDVYEPLENVRSYKCASVCAGYTVCTELIGYSAMHSCTLQISAIIPVMVGRRDKKRPW